jgi:thioredoxin 1
MSSLPSVTDASFQHDVLDSDQTVLVEFWAEWCGPCRALTPVLEQLASEHADSFTVVKINADDNMDTAAKYRAMSLPMIKVFRDGEVVKTVVGAKPKRMLEQELAQFL